MTEENLPWYDWDIIDLLYLYDDAFSIELLEKAWPEMKWSA